MSNPINLRDLAAGSAGRPPYGFEEFARRRAAAGNRQRARVWSIAASVAVLGLVSVLALVTQSPEPAALVWITPEDGSAAPVGARSWQPAVVDVGQFEVTSELEDHIALLDAQISAARAYEAPAERLRQMEYAREQLNDSLQRVSYAQTLLGL